MIKEEYVSFETAKLLREKGIDKEFDADIVRYYSDDGEFENVDYLQTFVCPSLAMVVKYLRKVHNIDIVITLSSQFPYRHYKTKIYYKLDNPFFLNGFSRNYEDETEKAIKYCLENLI